MRIQTECGNCGAKFHTDDRHIGSFVACPKCGNQLEVHDALAPFIVPVNLPAGKAAPRDSADVSSVGSPAPILYCGNSTVDVESARPASSRPSPKRYLLHLARLSVIVFQRSARRFVDRVGLGEGLAGRAIAAFVAGVCAFLAAVCLAVVFSLGLHAMLALSGATLCIAMAASSVVLLARSDRDLEARERGIRRQLPAARGEWSEYWEYRRAERQPQSTPSSD